jgi:UDP-N-acetylglucosamine 2-epimerase (non-hydrolysing)
MIDIIFGTRPEAIKLALLAKLCREKFPEKVRVISTGQHKEMLDQVLEWFEIKPDVDLNIMTANQSLAGLTSICLEKLNEFYANNPKPNLLIVQGDTTTAFASALTAFYNKIAVAHVEAGLRTYDKWSPFPEEINRKLIGQIADLHFAPTQMAFDVLANEKIDEKKLHLTGNTVIDALLYSKNKIDAQNYFPQLLEEYYTGTKSEEKIVLITGHRRENFGQGFQDICLAIKTLSKKYPKVSFIYPVHLNPNVKDVVYELLGDLPNVKLIAPLSYPDFISLMDRSYFILTDSGGVQEEAPSLGKPVLIMRNNTERGEGVAAGVVKLIGTDAEQIIIESSRLLEEQDYYNSFLRNQNPYGNGDSSEQIIKLIQSYV